MTAAQIRAKAKLIEDNSSIDVEVSKVLFLAEIAAQIADLNEHFRAVDQHVFGDNKPFKPLKKRGKSEDRKRTKRNERNSPESS